MKKLDVQGAENSILVVSKSNFICEDGEQVWPVRQRKEAIKIVTFLRDTLPWYTYNSVVQLMQEKEES